MSRLPALTLLALALPLDSCAPSLPTAPDLSPVLQAYAMPTAVVDGTIMAEFAEEIAEAAEEIENSELLDEILDLLVQVQQDLEASTAKACNGGANDGNACTNDAGCPDGTCVTTGDLVLSATCSGGENDGDACDVGDVTACPNGTCGGGVVLPSPTGAVNVSYVCPGWDERQFDEDYDDSPDPANGAIDLFLTVVHGDIGAVVWGTADECQYLVPIEGDSCDAAGCFRESYDGGIALDLGPSWVSEDISELPVTFILEGNIGFEGDDFRINQSFRVVLADESFLEILVDIGDPALSETFNYIIAADGQGIRDATGVFGCSLEERRCFDESGILFSW